MARKKSAGITYSGIEVDLPAKQCPFQLSKLSKTANNEGFAGTLKLTPSNVPQYRSGVAVFIGTQFKIECQLSGHGQQNINLSKVLKID